MGMSWTGKAKQGKSPWSVLAGFPLKSREAEAAKCKQPPRICPNSLDIAFGEAAKTEYELRKLRDAGLLKK